jgi:hypothetical protein
MWTKDFITLSRTLGDVRKLQRQSGLSTDCEARLKGINPGPMRDSPRDPSGDAGRENAEDDGETTDACLDKIRTITHGSPFGKPINVVIKGKYE